MKPDAFSSVRTGAPAPAQDIAQIVQEMRDTIVEGSEFGKPERWLNTNATGAQVIDWADRLAGLALGGPARTPEPEKELPNEQHATEPADYGNRNADSHRDVPCVGGRPVAPAPVEDVQAEPLKKLKQDAEEWVAALIRQRRLVVGMYGVDADDYSTYITTLEGLLALLPAVSPQTPEPRRWKECAQCIAQYPSETKGLSECCEAILVNVTDAEPAVQPSAQATQTALQAVVDAMTNQQDISAKYHELLYAVARKWPNETRHQTALRYIQQAETPSDQVGCAVAPPTEPRA